MFICMYALHMHATYVATYLDPLIWAFICRDLYSRSILDVYLSRALNIELENERLALIDKSNYVLTLDYTMKMLNIHER